MTNTENKVFYTDYYTAAYWGGTALVLCNNIANIDNSIYDNMEFDFFDENGEPKNIYQWFITNETKSDIEWKKQTFPELLYTYSNLLDCYILCVDHFGTMWKGVQTPVINKDWIEANKDLEYKGL